jgi:hypothetical protein
MLYVVLKIFILCLLCNLVVFFTQAQKQLVVLKRQEVIKRYNPGDDIVIRKKGEKTLLKSYINNLSDTSVITHNDTIPYHHIERIYFKQRSFLNTLGAVLVIAGTGFFLIDQFNNVVVYGNGFQLDPYVTNRSIPAVAIGLPLYLIRKKSRRPGHKYRLIMADEGSIFYRDNRPSGFQPPAIPSN